MLNKKVKVSFEHNGYDVTAMGVVLSQALVVKLDMHFHEIEEKYFPSGNELREIKELAREYLVDKAYFPEVEV
jgi:hypothetical protein